MYLLVFHSACMVKAEIIGRTYNFFLLHCYFFTYQGIRWYATSVVFFFSLVVQKEYMRYKQLKGWKNLVVYKSRIHALGLYTSCFIPHGAMVSSKLKYQRNAELPSIIMGLIN